MFLPGLLIDVGAPPAEFRGVAAVALVRRHELDAAVTVLVVEPIHERTQQPARCQLHRRARLPNRRRTALRSGHRCRRQYRRGPQAPKHEGFQD